MAERLRRAIWLAEYIGNERKRAGDLAYALVQRLLAVGAREQHDVRCPPHEVTTPAGPRHALALLEAECAGLAVNDLLAELGRVLSAPLAAPRAQLAFAGMLS